MAGNGIGEARGKTAGHSGYKGETGAATETGAAMETRAATETETEGEAGRRAGGGGGCPSDGGLWGEEVLLQPVHQVELGCV